MKRTVLRTLLALAAALCLVPLALIFCAVGLPAQYTETFLGEMPAKLQRLRETSGQRIIVVGGSSVPFGLDSALMEEQLPDYQVVDFGLYADMGMTVMLDWARTEVHPGDLFVLVPEQHAQALSTRMNGEDVWQACDGAFGQLTQLAPSRREALLAALPAFAGKKLRYAVTGAPQISGIYARSSFNAYGDMASPDRARNILPDGYDPNSLISFAPDLFSDELLEEIAAFAQDVTARGARVVCHFAPMNAAALAPGTTRQVIDDYFDALSARMSVPLLGNPHACLLPAPWFYDSNFHLNTAGSVVFTKLLVEDVKLFLSDTSPTDIALPSMPELADTSFAGDDSCADCFTFVPVSGGWLLSGLTAKGQNAQELILPTAYEGMPVVGMSDTLLHGQTQVRQVTVQPNVRTLADGVFSGCTALRQLILTSADPAGCMVGDGLMDGAQFFVCVPAEALDSYRRSYFWQKYEAWLQGVEPSASL